MRKYVAFLTLFTALVLLASTGCDQTPAEPPKLSPEIEAEVAAEKAKEAEAAASKAAAEPEFDVKVAGVGATGKGNYGVNTEYDVRAIITTPISTYFHA
ncbi:MAG: hypothetical protein HUK22_02040, partial [Thermoguttaceae bacterium]|nr:hypothetical protein [Thermoguttaceae bacterium]